MPVEIMNRTIARNQIARNPFTPGHLQIPLTVGEYVNNGYAYGQYAYQHNLVYDQARQEQQEQKLAGVRTTPQLESELARIRSSKETLTRHGGTLAHNRFRVYQDLISAHNRADQIYEDELKRRRANNDPGPPPPTYPGEVNRFVVPWSF